MLITCGTIEENRFNNEAMAAALRRQHHPVTVRLVPDAHTMIGWRDAWFPALDSPDPPTALSSCTAATPDSRDPRGSTSFAPDEVAAFGTCVTGVNEFMGAGRPCDMRSRI